MHKPLPGRLINAALPGPCARQFGLIGIATCADLARVEGMLCRGKCVARLPRDGPCVQPGSWWDSGCSVKRCEQPSAGWVRLRVAPCRVEPVTVKVAPCGPALTDFVPWGSSVPPRLGCKCAWWDLEITQSGTEPRDSSLLAQRCHLPSSAQHKELCRAVPAPAVPCPSPH